MVTDALSRHFAGRGGFTVNKAVNAEQAFDILESCAIDVVVSDERMPGHPTDLVITIEQAVAYKRLEARSREMLREFRRQAQMLESMAPRRADLLELELDDSVAIVVPESAADPNIGDLLLEIEAAMVLTRQRNVRTR
jgi:DNA-binding NarL/FixJ family response regulator